MAFLLRGSSKALPGLASRLLSSSLVPTCSALFARQYNLPSQVKEQLKQKNLKVDRPGVPFYYNASVSELYELGLNPKYPAVDALPTQLCSQGALVAYSGAKTGRSPKDKRIVSGDEHEKNVAWGKVNIKLDQQGWKHNRARGIDYLNTRPRIYVVDGYAGWDPAHQIKVRVVASRAYHALFMKNMLIRPTEEQLKDFLTAQPDFTIFNAGEFPSDPLIPGVGANASITLNLGANEAMILGSQYAGEMKKGVFSLMHYLMPRRGVLSLHSSATEGPKGDVTLFFGLSGTGKTTLSADPKRALIGDDEHCWSDNGIFNIEGGCYAKCNALSPTTEPDIFNAIRYGSVLENVIMDPESREVDYNDLSITENTRLCYPIEFMPTAKVPSIAGHPSNIIFLTCDAYGVLPPVSKLTPEQASYHFINGYTAKVAGTEVGVTEPTATFSACFGEAFLILHPAQYGDMLAEKMKKYNAKVWLVNTGWSGGGPGVGKRMSLPMTRAIIDAIHSGELAAAPTQKLPIFNLEVPKSCTGVPPEVLYPPNAWKDKNAYNSALTKLAKMFQKSFEPLAAKAGPTVLKGGPQL
eukprot:gb/GEZN01001767.1/.p1 GENE.gb/GEZN01001767.1/~~gb/GEZN01001767.1/.p1  ORF type:complete len:580 (-),score=100.69 gb/GEZN01001767.1/:374-2113(-)